MKTEGHIPVLLGEVLRDLKPRDGGAYVDGTFGLGGYTRAILEAADSTVWAIDRDPDAIYGATSLKTEFGSRFSLFQGKFSGMAELLRAKGLKQVDGVVFDLGVSSPQLTKAERGFSFRLDGPLDMRMEQQGATAADLVNFLSEEELAQLIKQLGQERWARRVARAIVKARNVRPIGRTLELAEIVRSAVPKSQAGIDSATRTFMALRIQVNDELGELDAALRAAEVLLSPGGRLIVVSFHSLEDQRVKRFLQERSGALPLGSRHLPQIEARNHPSFSLLRRSTIKPDSVEIKRNRRARSARLRAAERTEAIAWPQENAA